MQDETEGRQDAGARRTDENRDDDAFETPSRGDARYRGRPGAEGGATRRDAEREGDWPPVFDVPVVTLRGARGVHRYPWIYKKTLRSVPRGINDGDEVVVAMDDGTPIGRGFYHGRSVIAVRLLSQTPEVPLDLGFFRRKLADALSLRLDTLSLARTTNAFRWVHGEADGLSGLIVDVYDDLIAVEHHSRGLFERRDTIRHALLDLAPPGARMVERIDTAAVRHEGMIFPDGTEQRGEDVEVEILEGKMRFLVSSTGHKTGFFLDQRENRRDFATFVRGKKVLDLFAYTGGFSIAAKTLGKARKVVAVDLDEDAVEQGKRNSHLNRAEIEWVHSDAFDYLRRQQHAVDPFEAVVVDPPKWAQGRELLEDAERRYVDVNRYACRVVKPGGMLLTCSCSGLVSEEKFLRILRHAAELAGRDLQILRITGAASDHPVSCHFPESRYLKAVYARVLE